MFLFDYICLNLTDFSINILFFFSIVDIRRYAQQKEKEIYTHINGTEKKARVRQRKKERDPFFRTNRLLI